MLFALGHPPALVGLVLGFLVGVCLAGAVQNRLAARLKVGTGAERARFAPTPRRQIDPYGTVAAALGGVGWVMPVEAGRWRRGPARTRLVFVLLAAPATHLVLAAVGVGILAAQGKTDGLGLIDARAVFHGSYVIDFASLTTLGFLIANLTMALLHIVPLPPMAVGRILFLVGPQSPAWQRAAYHLEENNWGVGILIAISLPIFGGSALSADLTAALAKPLLALVG